MTKYTTLSEELNKLPRERQRLIELRAFQIHLEKFGLFRSELVENLYAHQPAVFKHRQNKSKTVKARKFTYSGQLLKTQKHINQLSNQQLTVSP
jgi:hypothetical protein